MMFQRAIASLISTAFLLLIGNRAWSIEAPEYKIKALYLYNFAKFTEWPREKMQGKGPLFLCIVGKDPFAGDLEKLAEGKTIKGHPLEIRYHQITDPLKSCHLLFMTGVENASIKEVLKNLSSEHVLSVGEMPEFIQLGGHIWLFVKEEKVGFEINLPVVEGAGLKIDARVLNIAKIRR